MIQIAQLRHFCHGTKNAHKSLILVVREGLEPSTPAL